ncbi:HTH-type transcriptional regulator HdfR [Pseudomaricurvus alkylphenolicus]|jgi:DNA-binding transcriptional LysR family regulator|uniref:HTH-type transcriptional regulator HdfR n=1 Tax=Pseudomaricurvus alkylphenolicus TaxID=1306991 RepID=UPI00141EC874|nr:HTH-type transcriptional regulator HdfR [Pseudomaricurvus alkylphenolicus]NIB41886.1 HTH-type transcriptional regulator HdfR [Pseudomaricurvus alkylphenolicus]
MNTELLRTFLEVSRTRHFGQAAENLFLTQSAVSFRIKQLEDTVGVPLLTRERNNIRLTPSGERLLPHAENILASWQVAIQDVAVSEQHQTQLALGGTSNLWDTFLQALLPELANDIPGLYLRTEISSPQQLTRALLAGRLDLMVLLDPPQLAEVSSARIGRIELVLVSSGAHTQLEDIAKIGHVFVDWGTAFNLQQAKLLPQAVVPVLHTAQSQIALEFLLSRGGVAFLPKAMVQPYLEEARLHQVGDMESISRDVHACYSSSSLHSESLLEVVELLKAAELKPTDPRTDWDNY